MFKKFFKNVAEKENGTFYFKDESIHIGAGVRSPNVLYLVKFKYRDNEISVMNRTGTAFIGEIECKLSPTLQPIEFELTSISHIINLFFRKKSRFRIKSNNENIKYFLNNNVALKTLNEIAQRESFSPYIVCDLNGNKRITTEYNLEFDDWTLVVEPIIELYKNLIDEFEKRVANISLSAYREMK